MEKTERLLDLVALLLDAREPVSFAELRELFPEEYGGPRAAAERKLERDKAELLQLGVPIEYLQPSRLDERELGGYRIDRQEFFLPDPKLLPEEAAALYAAGAAALAARDFPFAHDLQHALRKISLAGSGEPAVAVAAARRLLVVRPGDAQRAAALRQLADAVARRKRVHIRYSAPPSLDGKPGETTERDVDPWGLAFRGGTWRMVGYCHLRTAQRTFVVDRIGALSVNPKLPASPDFDAPAGFDAGAAAGQKPWQWAHGAPQEISLAAAPGSEALLERVFEAPSGKLEARFVDGLIPSVLSLGERVWIRGPRGAREKILKALEKLDQLLRREPDPAPAEAPPPQPAAQQAQPAPLDETRQDRLRRLLLVVPAARRRPRARLSELAQELGLDAEELRDDIEFLGLVGRPPFSPDDLIDISVDERDRVTVALDQSFSRPPQLTALEALALAAAGEVAPADPAVMSALDKLTEKLPAPARGLYAQLARRLAAATPPPPGAAKVLAQLRKAAQEHKEIALSYDKEGRGDAQERIFRPQGVIDHGGVRYAIGPAAGRNSER